MAIIIGAIILIIIAICGYVKYNVNILRKKERNFYDIFFLTMFFQFLLNSKQYNNFIKSNASIKVCRKIRIIKKASDINSLNYKYNKVFDLRNDKGIIEKNKFANCIIYEFIGENDKLELCLLTNYFYNKVYKYINNSSFLLDIDSKKIKMVLRDTFKGKIFLKSTLSIFQSLMFIYQVEEQGFSDMPFCNLINVFEETANLMEYLKTAFCYVGR